MTEVMKVEADPLGFTVRGAEISEDRLVLTLEDGRHFALWDAGQSCCEHRYMRTDDDVQAIVGGVLTGMEVKEAPDERDDWGVHEVRFLEVRTTKGSVTIANHNEHNGYYGGFWLKVTEISSPKSRLSAW